MPFLNKKPNADDSNDKRGIWIHPKEKKEFPHGYYIESKDGLIFNQCFTSEGEIIEFVRENFKPVNIADYSIIKK